MGRCTTCVGVVGVQYGTCIFFIIRQLCTCARCSYWSKNVVRLIVTRTLRREGNRFNKKIKK